MANKIDNVKVKAGRLIKVENQDSHKAANKTYISIWVESADGKNEHCILLTEKEYQRAVERAEKNKEDLPAKSKFTNLLD